MTLPNNFTAAERKAELWRRGLLSAWKLHAGQRKIYDAFHGTTQKKFVVNCSRRLGKSYLLCLMALEHAIKHPNSFVKYAAPSQKMVRKIITPLMKQLMADCPKALRPRYVTLDGVWIFPNGSEISVAGTEQGQVDNLRGTACDLALIDEAAFCTDLDYVLDSILLPQTLTRPNARIVLGSTPPVTPDHPFLRYTEQAMAAGSYIKLTIYDNPMLTPKTIEEYMQESGGADSTTWRREYLAEFVTDRDSALFPEATDDVVRDITQDLKRPEYFLPMTSIDLGYLDCTGVVLGHYDFLRGKVIVEDELLMAKKTSAEIVAEVKAKEKALWLGLAPRARVVDGSALQIADLNATHQLACHSPSKSDLQANVNAVRMALADRQLLIHPRCTQLLSQLRFATWNAQRNKFSRNSGGGHWDLIAALIYFMRHVDKGTNPMPPGYGYVYGNSFGVPSSHPQDSHNALRSMFPTLRRT